MQLFVKHQVLNDIVPHKPFLQGCKFCPQKRLLSFISSFLLTGSLVTLLSFPPTQVLSSYPAIVLQSNLLAADDDESELRPFVDCVNEEGEGLVAYFGYNNRGHEITLEIGKKNYFSPGPSDRGQPTQFFVGQHHNVVTVQFDANGSIKWNLDGKTAKASFDSPRCEFPTPTAPHPTLTSVPPSSTPTALNPTSTSLPASSTPTAPRPTPGETCIAACVLATSPVPIDTLAPTEAPVRPGLSVNEGVVLFIRLLLAILLQFLAIGMVFLLVRNLSRNVS